MSHDELVIKIHEIVVLQIEGVNSEKLLKIEVRVFDIGKFLPRCHFVFRFADLLGKVEQLTTAFGEIGEIKSGSFGASDGYSGILGMANCLMTDSLFSRSFGMKMPLSLAQTRMMETQKLLMVAKYGHAPLMVPNFLRNRSFISVAAAFV